MQDKFIKIYTQIPRIGKHILFWFMFASFYAILWGSFNDEYSKQFALQFIFLPPKILATYLTMYWLLPQYLLKDRYFLFFGWVIVVLLVAGVFNWALSIYIENPYFYPEENYGLFWNPLKILKSATYIYPVVVLATLIKFFKHWYKNQQMAQRFKQDKLQAELKFLKAQVHPHFLFNTLNNLYALTLKKSERAPEIVLKLSDLLNYMLYECNTEIVPLKKEIELVQNYVALERLRYGDRLDVSFHVKVDSKDASIAPMLILPFVENSFKHGVSGETDKSWVSIDLQVKDNLLTLKVDNSKSNGHTKDEREYREGIGLNNVKRRLELLYEGGYELKILDTDESYLVVLKLELDEQ
jgi:two-component system, LytTR family, sensor kinase